MAMLSGIWADALALAAQAPQPVNVFAAGEDQDDGKG
jgi:hypothetical protein